MLTTRSVAGALSLTLMLTAATIAHAQNFPVRPIRVYTAEAGGANDFTSRLIAQGVSASTGQQMIVDNRPELIGIQAVAKAAPDGYSVIVSGSGFWLGPLIQKMPYDPIADFSPVTMLVRSPLLLTVHPSVPANSVQELIALAKAKPGTLNYGSSPTGSSSHLAGELFKYMAGVDIVRVIYKGNGPALNDMLGGRVQLMFIAAGVLTPHLNTGRLKALAVTTAEPTALFPNLPTVAASGVPGYESVSVVGMFAPAKTPPAIIMALNQDVVRVLSSPEVKQKLAVSGVEAVGNSPEEMLSWMKAEMTRISKLVQAVGIRVE